MNIPNILKFTGATPLEKGLNGLDTSKGLGEVKKSLSEGSLTDKGFSMAKLGSTLLGMVPGFALHSSVASLNLNFTDNMRKGDYVGGARDLVIDTAKVATSLHPVANLTVRSFEVVGQSFVYCAQHPEEYAKFRSDHFNRGFHEI